MIGFISNLFKQSNNAAEQKVVEAAHETDILNNLRKNISFKINVTEVDCLRYSRKYIKQLFDAIDRSELVQKLLFLLESGDYKESDWKIVADRINKNTNIKTIVLVGCISTISGEVLKLLEKSKSITRLEIQFPFNMSNIADINMQRAHFGSLSNVLYKNTSINAFKISECMQTISDVIQPLLEVICKKQIYTMELHRISYRNLSAFTSQLLNSSITDLIISDLINDSAVERPNFQPLGDLLTKNGNIKRLSLLGTGIKDQHFGPIADGIKKSKNLTQLSMVNESMSEQYVAEIIEHNTSLVSLASASISSPFQDLALIADSLKKNSTLTRLDIQGKNITSQGYINLGEAMRVNNTLKKLYLSHNERMNNADVAPFFEGLKFNTGLNVLAITKHISGVGYYTNEIMKTNRALIDVIPREYEYEKKPHPQLILNKKNQDDVVLGGKSLVCVIYWHTDSFLALLPLEIWYNILSHVSCPGVAINFPRELKELFRRKNNQK